MDHGNFFQNNSPLFSTLYTSCVVKYTVIIVQRMCSKHFRE